MLLIYSLVYFYYGNLCKAEVVNSAPHSLKVGSGRNDIESSVGFNSNSNHVNLEAIDGTPNYRIYGGKKSLEDKHWLDGRGLGMEPMKCVRRSNCEPLSFSTCLGAKIPYEYTSLDLTFNQNQRDVKERLDKYQTLKYIPKCWSVIQVKYEALLYLVCNYNCLLNYSFF